jgi:hypothetical protein
MKRLKRIAGLFDHNINDADLTITFNGLENEKSEVLFEEDGVRFKVSGDFSFIAKYEGATADQIKADLDSATKEDVIAFIEKKSGYNIEKVINDYANGSQHQEWQLPTKTGINAWYTPKELKLKNIDIKNIFVDDDDIKIGLNFVSENEATSYNDLGVEKEEYEIYEVDPKTFKFSKDEMTGEFYR